LSKRLAKKENPDLPPQRYPVFDQEFREGLAWWFKRDRAKAEKILDLVTDVMEHPFTGLGKPEPLRYLGADVWSRRIDLEHRLVYRVIQTQVDFIACRYHYGD
jgi:toxin YoeB